MNYVKGMFEKAQETWGIDLMQLVSLEGRKRQHSQSHLDQQNKHLNVTETITFFLMVLLISRLQKAILFVQICLLHITTKFHMGSVQ